MPKALLLLSGGLDSTLAGKLLLDQGIEVEAVNYVTPFCRCSPKNGGCSAARNAAEMLGIPVTVRSLGEEYLAVIKSPRFGRGKGMNPCIDCRVFMFSAARTHMEETGADFIATGEVVGERPMSQNRRSMQLIERKSGLTGMVVRPLSAKLLPPGIPEREGYVDRTRLAGISGRRRLPQFELAERIGVYEYLCPAGGCLLTDPSFAARFTDLLEHDPECGMPEVRLLSYGRHFRLPSGRKIIMGRNEGDNAAIVRLGAENYHLLEPDVTTGPTVLVGPDAGEEDIRTAAGLLAGYTKGGIVMDVAVQDRAPDGARRILRSVSPADRDAARTWLIGDEKTIRAERAPS